MANPDTHRQPHHQHHRWHSVWMGFAALSSHAVRAAAQNPTRVGQKGFCRHRVGSTLGSVVHNCIQIPFNFDHGLLRVSHSHPPSKCSTLHFRHHHFPISDFSSVYHYHHPHRVPVPCSRRIGQVDGSPASEVKRIIAHPDDDNGNVETSCAEESQYILEQSLLVDNLFVFVLIFKYFKVPVSYQNRVLSYGIAGAVFFRLAIILLGAATLQRYEAVNLLLAAILLYSSFKDWILECYSQRKLIEIESYLMHAGKPW